MEGLAPETTQAPTTIDTDSPGTEADFLAGFADVRGGDTAAAPAQETTAAADEQSDAAGSANGSNQDDGSAPPADDTGASAPQDSNTPSAQPASAGSSAAQPSGDELSALRAELSRIQQVGKGLETLAGTVGGLKRQLEQIAKSQPQGSPAAEGAKKVLADIKLKRLQEAYPDVADVLAQDLAEMIPATGTQSAAVDSDQIEQIVERRVADRTASLEERFERRMLALDHPTWEADIAARDPKGQVMKDATGKFVPAADFVQWLGSKGNEYAQTFTTTTDSTFLSRGLTEFKQFRAKAAQSRSSKQARLAGAVAPTGAAAQGAPTSNDTDEFMAGFKSVRGSP